MKKKLLVIISDALSDLVRKGEITARYYNPGDLFDEVHILMTNDDKVDPADVQIAVGRANLYLHNVGVYISLEQVLGWCPVLLNSLVTRTIALAREIGPSVVRAYGNYLNGYYAAQIKKQLDVPFVVSLHTHPDDMRYRTPWWPSWKSRLILEFQKTFEKETLRNADYVISVYESQKEYALRYGAKHTEVIYNIINPTHLHRKTDYRLHRPARIISVGRQSGAKNPDNIIRAAVRLDAELTLIGDGEYHECLKSLARECGIAGRVIFEKAAPNDKLCEMLPEYDIFAAHNDYWGIPKAVMEPLLMGLPVVINRHYPEPVYELEGNWVISVENTDEGYYQAIKKLIENDAFRERLGLKGWEYAYAHWEPAETEAKTVELYKRVMKKEEDCRCP